MAFPLLNRLNKKRKRFDPDLCLICQETSDEVFVKPKSLTSSVKKIKEVSTLRLDSLSETIDNYADVGFNNLKWHRNCYSSYTSSRNVARKLKNDTIQENDVCEEGKDTPSTSLGFTRSSLSKCDYKKCIICQNDTKKK